MEITELMQKKINDGREYRKMLMKVRNLEGEDFIVEGYATTFNEKYNLYSFDGEHYVKEMVDSNAFEKCDMSDVIMQYDHEGKVYARTSNDTLKLTIDNHGLLVRAYLGGTQIGRNLFEEIKGGYTTKMSFGFTVKEDDFVEDGKDYLRTIKAIGKLYDVSAVSIPANDFTEISARNHCEGVIAEIEQERVRIEEEKRVRQEQVKKLEERLKALRKD